MYTKKTLELFKNPKHMGEIKKADASATEGNPVCGDQLKMTLKIKKGVIKDAKMATWGCVSAIAVAEALCRMVIGKSVAEAKKITPKDVENYLGKLPLHKLHCAVLGHKTLKKAIEAYENR